MRSALVLSVGLHLVALILWVTVGSRVSTTRLQMPGPIRVRITTSIQQQTPPPVRQPEQPEPEQPEPQQPEPEPAHEAEPVPVPEPERPTPRPREERPRPEPAPERPPRRPEPQTAEADTTPAEPRQPELPERTSVAGTDTQVPARYRYYLALLEGAISRQWQPQRIGFRQQSQRVCVVHFHVEQDGRITREQVVRSSGVPLLDREALRAVRAVGRLQPLPAGMARGSLGVTFVFTLEAGI